MFEKTQKKKKKYIPIHNCVVLILQFIRIYQEINPILRKEKEKGQLCQSYQ